MKLKHFIILFLPLVFLSCGKESSDAEESFELWARHSVPGNFTIIDGQFWKSPHWTYEYITYLHFRAPKKWIDEFIKSNDLEIAVGNHEIPDEAPDWFVPEVGQKVYVEKGFTQGSMYFVNEKTGEVLFYEIQL
jgi:hypothetical protein